MIAPFSGGGRGQWRGRFSAKACVGRSRPRATGRHCHTVARSRPASSRSARLGARPVAASRLTPARPRVELVANLQDVAMAVAPGVAGSRFVLVATFRW